MITLAYSKLKVFLLKVMNQTGLIYIFMVKGYESLCFGCAKENQLSMYKIKDHNGDIIDEFFY